MVAVALACTLAFVFTAAIVSVRLLALARVTGGLPELTCGLGLGLIVALGLPVRLVGDALLEAHWSLGVALLVASGSSFAAGWTALAVFTWKVFRPDSFLVGWAVRGAILVFAGSTLAEASRLLQLDDPSMAKHLSSWSFVTLFTAELLYAWTGFEALRCYRQFRRRLALGLADPVVTNRFLLWATVMGCSMISLGAPLYAGWIGLSPMEIAEVQLTTALAGLPCTAALYLAFLAPRSYRDWVLRRSARTS